MSEKIAEAGSRPVSPVGINDLLQKCFNCLIDGGKVLGGDGRALTWLPNGGMSGGMVHLPTWHETLLPELRHRFAASGSGRSGAVEYHPAEHRFRFAAWAAATAARSSRSVCTFPVPIAADLLRESSLRWLALGSHWLPLTQKDFDAAHDAWCHDLERRGKDKISPSFSYGIAAKMMNCYLKALFLQTMVGAPFAPYDERGDEGPDRSTRYLHPPIDRVLMMEARRQSNSDQKAKWQELIDIGWSKFGRRDYKLAIKLIREMVGENAALGEVYWIGYQ